MKLKNKGKVYPSPSSSSSSYSSSGEDYLSILKLLPAAILALASVLSLEDREVLAYMITRSLKTTTTNSSLISQDYSSKKRSSKKPPSTSANLTQKSGAASHKPPVFDCECFDCYTSYWFRWDSSLNRELIHQVIEAFEDHLTNGEAKKPSKKKSRPQRRDGSGKTATQVPDTPVVDVLRQPDYEAPVLESSTEEAPVFTDDVISTGNDVNEEVAEVAEVTEELPVAEDTDEEVRTAAAAAAAAATTTSNHKGLARKVLPDVLGLFNSRLWGLWNPNV
ncbi:uncharacterized protein LOC111318021 [Durio zibethinus]|uniref:Uncharacterized protein LOC111318021 n=1 Tax=Durio zibethinus TaxID=66656 RepID=A0A6P6BGZ2_DURZI|nr:uncharacterized protein LOC111318021 [Durio zibethinus]